MSVVGIEMYNNSPCNMASMSAPSSPRQFFYSAPSSRHGSPPRELGQSQMTREENPIGDFGFEFEFSALCIGSTGPDVSADELFDNGRIRPMGAQNLISEGLETEEVTGFNGAEGNRGRGLLKVVSPRRRTRSLSPLRNPLFLQEPAEGCKLEDSEEHKAPIVAESKKGRFGSKRWISLKDFLYRSKSEGSGQTQYKHWALSFSSSTAKQQNPCPNKPSPTKKQGHEGSYSIRQGEKSKTGKSKTVPELGSANHIKRHGKVPVSAHELLYTTKRAQAEEQKHKTFLPYRQGLFGFVGFTSKS